MEVPVTAGSSFLWKQSYGQTLGTSEKKCLILLDLETAMWRVIKKNI